MANDYSDMSRMQQEAIRRVQEMQSRAQQNIRSNTSEPPRNPPREPEPHRNELAAEHHAENPLSDIFGSLMQDKERTLILVLLLLLVDEKADTSLIFALMYLII